MPDCGFSLKYKWFLVGLKGGQVGVVWLLVLAWNAWMILAGCLDLFSTRWNVEDDILLRGEIVTPRKEWFSFYVYFCWTSGGAQFLNWKRNKKFCEKLKGQIRSQIRPDLGRIAWGFWKKMVFVSGQNPAGLWRVTVGQRLWPAVSFITYPILAKISSFLSWFIRASWEKNKKSSSFFHLQFLLKSWVLTDGFGKYFIQGLTMVV